MLTKTIRFAAFCLLMLALFAGCEKNANEECDGKTLYTFYRPILQSLTEARNKIKWGVPQPITQPGKIYLYKQYILLTEPYKGIHVFDNSRPAAPVQTGFIRIDGSTDFAIRNDVLYADSYGDMVIIPINDLPAAKAAAFKNNVFYQNNYYNYNGLQTDNPDSIQVVADYEKVDTLIDCNTLSTWMTCGDFADASGNIAFSSLSGAAKSASGGNGTGGSMARFTLVGHYLYTVSYSEFFTFDLTNALDPSLVNKQQPGWDMETIFPFKNNLFIGSFTGMYIYNIADAAQPQAMGTFNHARVCDPVVADDNYAYVTLRSGNGQCQGFTNQLDVVNIADMNAPKLLKSYPLTNPHGLSKEGNQLFICVGTDGLKVFDATNAANIKLRQTISNIGQTFDVIAQNGLLLVVSDKGIFQYRYGLGQPVKFVSKIYSAD